MSRLRSTVRRGALAAVAGAVFAGSSVLGASTAHADIPLDQQGWVAELRSMTLVDDTGEVFSDEVYIVTTNGNGPDTFKRTRTRNDFDKGERHTFAAEERCVAPVAFLGSPTNVPRVMDAQKGQGWACHIASPANGFRFAMHALESDGSGRDGGFFRTTDDDTIGFTNIDLDRFELAALAPAVGATGTTTHVLNNGRGGSVRVLVDYRRVR